MSFPLAAAGEESAFGMSFMGLRALSLNSMPLDRPLDLRCCTGLQSLALTQPAVQQSHPPSNPSLTLLASHLLPSV